MLIVFFRLHLTECNGHVKTLQKIFMGAGEQQCDVSKIGYNSMSQRPFDPDQLFSRYFDQCKFTMTSG